MDIVTNFKEYLFTEKGKPSKVTIKNYLSDVRKFIQWYERTYTVPFSPIAFSSDVLKNYQTEIYNAAKDSIPAARSSKRYISSLRKFSRFLEHSGAIEANPFDSAPPIKANDDPWQLKGFNNHLVSNKASKLTIKNYIIDVRQFLDWLEKVSATELLNDDTTRFLTIDNYALEQYKERLLSEKRFSPTSINRKLSSLRKYTAWLTEKGLLEIKQAPVEVKEEQEEAPAPVIAIAPVEMPLTALKELPVEKDDTKEATYSRFAPVRLAQKTNKIISLGFGSLIISPIAHSVEAIQYALWKRTERDVFAPVKTILENASALPTPEEIVAPVVASTGMNLTAKAASIVNSIVRVKSEVKPYAVRNISKSFYAPLRISLKELSWQQRLLHHLRYTRPAWYKKYHAFPVVHHIHFAILILATVVSGVGSYFSLMEQPRGDNMAQAALPTSPPRTLTFQGRLLDRTNTPITADTHLRFAIYNSPNATGSALLWQETQEIDPNQDGAFTALLGSKTLLQQQVFDSNPNLYIGMTVGLNKELTPRQQIPTAGLATNSQTLQGLKPITKTDDTENVVLALDSAGDLTIGGTASPTFQATGGQFTLSGQSLLLTTILGSNGNVIVSPDGTGIIDLQKPIQNTSEGVSASGIRGAVEILDALAVLSSTSSQSALTVRQNSTGDIISGISSGIAKFRVDGGGTGMFAGNLTINGNTITTNSTSFGIANTNVMSLSIGNSATSISLGATSGVTTINNTLNVKGETEFTKLITAKGSLTIPHGQTLNMADMAPGAIPFIGSLNQIAQDAGLAWSSSNKALNVTGSLCLRSTAGACSGSSAGTIYATNATVQAADLAENYTSAQVLEPGDVVIPEGRGNNLAVIKATEAYQPQVIGIISTEPGFTLNSDAKADAKYPYVYPLALQGRVPVKVSSMNGEIKAGDPLTSSPVPGVAMKATKSGQIIAKALEDYSNENTTQVTKIMAFVNVTYHASQSTITDQGNLSLAENITSDTKNINTDTNIAIGSELGKLYTLLENIESGVIAINEISTQSLKVATDNIFVGGQQISEYIAGIVKTTVSPYLANTPATGESAYPYADITNATAAASLAITYKEPIASRASEVHALPATASAAIASQPITETQTTGVNNIYNSIASQSAQIQARPTIAVTPTATPVSSQGAAVQPSLPQTDSTSLFNPELMKEILTPEELGLEKLDVKEAAVSNSLTVLGRTTLSDVGITGKVNIGLLSIDGLGDDAVATINTASGPLKFQSDGFNGIDFMNGKITIDTKGSLNVNGNAFFAKNVTVKGKLAANVIAPIPGSDLTVENDHGNEVVRVSQKGDVEASGSGKFAKINIVRGVQADTSITETTSNGSAGKSVIKAKHKERTIYSPYVTKDSLIYVTATSDTQKMTPYVARQTVEDGKGSFSVQIPNAVGKDITFNWWIVN